MRNLNDGDVASVKRFVQQRQEREKIMEMELVPEGATCAPGRYNPPSITARLKSQKEVNVPAGQKIKPVIVLRREMKDIENIPAFPVADFMHPNGQVEHGHCGMTLRDYFASTMQPPTELNEKGAEELIGRKFPREGTIFERCLWSAEVESKLRFIMADAMLQERAKES